MNVTRCVCRDISFRALKRIADAEGLDFERLSARTGCSTGCSLCGPYVRLMLATGRTSIPVMQPATIERLIAQAQEKAPGESPGD